MDRAFMTTGELAKVAGVNAETLRFYERRKLLPNPRRTASGHRRYGKEALARLQLIKRAQALGFSLPEIGSLLEAMEDPGSSCAYLCATVEMKLDQLDQLLAQLKIRRKRLLQLRDACPRVRPLSECPVIEDLVAKHRSRKDGSR